MIDVRSIVASCEENGGSIDYIEAQGNLEMIKMS